MKRVRLVNSNLFDSSLALACLRNAAPKEASRRKALAKLQTLYLSHFLV